PPTQRFGSRIGGLPYLYETILRKFVKTNQSFIDAGLLDVRLWKHEDNSFHLKGISVDGVAYLPVITLIHAGFCAGFRKRNFGRRSTGSAFGKVTA
ncbi:MAG: hypothetical protein U5L01_13485, partial [Rheinheimera sp.]|nr:hypothetical protein [Rheinheimera sp.]